MRLTRARVINYKSIDDSGWVNLEDVTALVGKNESGKTAFLQALRKLRSISGEDDHFKIRDYPRKGYTKYKKVHSKDPAVVVRAEFELTKAEVSEIETTFGKGVMLSNLVVACMNYKNRRFWEIDLPQSDKVGILRSEHNPQTQFIDPLVESKEEDIGNPEGGESISDRIAQEYLEKWMPKFVYFDNYSSMRGDISITDLKKRSETGDGLDEADRTFMSLLTLAGVTLGDLEQDLGYEDLKVELESASITITDEIFEYWQQNRQLKVEFDISQANPSDPAPLNEGKILHVRIENARHRVTVSFDERSKGFVWFFSFLCYFSHLEETEDRDLIMLLDEPGTALHAMAQQDFLRFIDERLAPQCQVLYTTHSPFMVDLDKLHRVRTVQDMDGIGTVVSNDAVNNDKETVFPLQMALGYQMAQTLLLAPHCLMVNSASDLIYLQVLGEMVARTDGIRIDPRWVVIPVGGAENLPTFVSLLGENYVSVAVMMDITPTNRTRVEKNNKSHSVLGGDALKWVEVTRVRDADIEDLFDGSLYLRLVNLAYEDELHEPITMRSITESNPRIVERIKTYFADEGIAGGVFDRYRPAAYLLANHEGLKQEISKDTLDRIRSLVERVNSLLPAMDNAGVQPVIDINSVQQAATVGS